jgi:II/X family phage/plasmid replication protein
VIDWLWLRLQVAAATRLPAGRVISVKPCGEIEWQTDKWLQARGSYDQSMALRMDARGQLNISGCPAKFLQGHNLFGSDDMRGLALAVVERCMLFFPQIVMDDAHREALDLGMVELLRADLTYMYATGSRERCIAWLRTAAETSHYRNRGRGLLDRETVYWGRGSRHSALKAYCKGVEIAVKGHGLPHPICSSEMLAYAEDALRIEAQLNARALRAAALNMVGNWDSETPARVYSDHLEKLRLSGNMEMKPAQIEALPQKLRLVYEAWRGGADLRSMFSRAQFYRHRRALLELGIDIAAAQATSNVVKLYTVIEAKPLGVPSWAVGTPLYFEPAGRRSA